MSPEKELDIRSLCEVVFDMTWAYAIWHDAQPEKMREQIINSFNDGSRGIFDMIYNAAKRFEVHWNKLSDDDKDLRDYYLEVDTWIEATITKIIVEL